MAKNNHLAVLLNVQTNEKLPIRRFPAQFIEEMGELSPYQPDLGERFRNGIEFVRQYSKTVVKNCGLAEGLWVNNLKVSNLLLNDGDTIRVNQVEFLYQENALFLAKESDSIVAKQVLYNKDAQSKKVAMNLLLVCGVFVVTSFLTLVICLMVQERLLNQRMIAEVAAERSGDAELAGTKKEPVFFAPDAKKTSKTFPAEALPDKVTLDDAEGGSKPFESTAPNPEPAQQVTDPLMATAPIAVNQAQAQAENTQSSSASEGGLTASGNVPIQTSEEVSPSISSASDADSPFVTAQEPLKTSEPLLFSSNAQTTQKKSGHDELSQELAEGHPQAAKKLVREFDQRYLSGSGKSILKEAKVLLAEPSVAETEKSVLQDKVETFSELVDLYEKGNRLYRSGNKDGAFKSWLDFLKAEKSVFGDEKSQYAREVTSFAVKALLDRAMKMQAQQQQIEAFQLREAAAKIEIEASGPAHQWVDQTIRKAEEQMKLAEQAEFSNIEQAKKHWQNVLDMLPKEHTIAEQAYSKLSWYQYQNP